MPVMFRVLANAGLVTPETRPRVPERGMQLLAFLALAPNGRATRRQLADLLWVAPEATGLGNLRQLLLRLRRNPAVAPLIDADAGAVWLVDAENSIDASRLLKLIDTRSLDDAIEALDLYHAELLADVADCTAQFADWLRGARETLHELFFAAASRALIELTRFGNAAPEQLKAVEIRMLAVERDREASYRALIEAYGRNGMKSEAVRLYAALEHVLKSELNADVSSETRAVFRRATAGLPGLTQGPARPEFDLARVAFVPLTMLGAAGDETLVRALFDDVANNLARYRSLTVLAVHSSFRRPVTGETARNLALAADYYVSGYVLPDGETLSLSMREQKTAKIIWAADYSIAPQQLISTFRMLSQQIAASLADALEHRRISAESRDPAPSAYLSFLRGKMELASTELVHLRRARKSFNAAAEEQVRYAAAHARVAQTLYLEWLLLGGTDPQLLLQARQHAEHAISYDKGGADGYWMRGVVGLYQRDFNAAEEHFAIAESLSPHSADLLVQYADALSHLGSPQEGWKRFERALQLNPMPPDHYWWAGASIAFVEERYDAVIALCAKMESDLAAIRLLASTHALLGDVGVAQTYARRVKETYPGATRETISALVPSRDRESVARFMEGLRLAGVV